MFAQNAAAGGRVPLPFISGAISSSSLVDRNKELVGGDKQTFPAEVQFWLFSLWKATTAIDVKVSQQNKESAFPRD